MIYQNVIDNLIARLAEMINAERIPLESLIGFEQGLSTFANYLYSQKHGKDRVRIAETILALDEVEAAYSSVLAAETDMFVKGLKDFHKNS